MRRTRSVVDPDFYGHAYPDLSTLSADALTAHWVTSGRAEGRIPNREVLEERALAEGISLADFDDWFYVGLYSDLANAGITNPESAAMHYVSSGFREGRIARPSFDNGEKFRPDDILFAFHHASTSVRTWNDVRRSAESTPGVNTRRTKLTDSNVECGLHSSAPSTFDMAVLVSLYRSDDFLDEFLGNLHEQTAFERCEISIVLVQPSVHERELCTRFASEHQNVRLDIREEPFGIYEAWNHSVRSTSARYLTNANVDDLRSPLSLELQIDYLDRHSDVDVAYHDMHLTPVTGASWDVVQRIGFHTNFGEVSTTSLLTEFNAPANAPAWRRTLHDSVGFFDTSYRSAADWEFWIRCSLDGATFRKMDTIHFCYFINDAGMSRRLDGPAFTESDRVMHTYRDYV